MLPAMTLDQHDFNEDGLHDRDECELCIEHSCSLECECGCGNCCERLLLEASIRDAQREPRIAAECGVIRDWDDAIIGYTLNDREKHGACHFFDQEQRLCTIYETRPLMCRVFNCDAERQSGDLANLLAFDPERPL